MISEPKLHVWLSKMEPEEVLEMAKKLEHRAHQCRMYLATQFLGELPAELPVSKILPDLPPKKVRRN